MAAQTATFVFILVILGLFVLDRDRKASTSKALWLPVVWLWIVGSREVSQWLATFGMRQTGVVDPSLDGNPLDRNVYAVLLVVGVITLGARGRQVRSLLRTNIPILLFFLYCGVSICWSEFPEVAFKRWIKALGDVVMVMIVLTERDRSVAVRRLLSRTAFLLIPFSILFIKYYPELGRWYKPASGTTVYLGITTNKNILGIICLLFGLGSLWRLLAAYLTQTDKNRSRSLIAHGALLLMVLWLFWKANSMTGLSCFLLAGGLMVAMSLSALARKPSVVHFLMAGVVFLSFSALFLGVGGGALEEMGRDATLTGRTRIWDLVLGVAGNPLVGTGFESFWLPGPRRDKLWNAYWWHPNEAHNGYIEVYLNLGWIGVSLLTAIILTGYRNIVSAMRQDRHLGTLCLAYFVVGVIYNFTEAGFRVMDPVWITFLLATMATSRARRPSAMHQIKNFAPREPQVDPRLLGRVTAGF